MIERVPTLQFDDLGAGKMVYFSIDGLPVALANVNGTVYAFGDSCRHEGGPLSAGVLIDATVTCPWHGWTYDVRSGKSIVPPVGLRIPTYPVEIGTDGMIYVLIDWGAA
ncbi:MAG: Rieske 2Fe-2S domain-containing protein [Oscillochloris sp.]|nr:Rieske 2Fe-2S domain-containing protein [Oscillochloris sp.]